MLFRLRFKHGEGSEHPISFAVKKENKMSFFKIPLTCSCSHESYFCLASRVWQVSTVKNGWRGTETTLV